MIPSTSQESAQNVSSSKNSNSSVTDRPETQNVKSKIMASMEHEYPWSCSVCGKPFWHKISFLKHRTLNECLICKICHMKFDLPEELYRHNETCRSPEYPHSKCSFGADTLMSLSEHMKAVHNTIDVLPISCDICSKKFLRRYHLKRHKETVHVDTLRKCPACRRNFKNKVLLEKHISLNNCLQCQICDQKFDVLEKFIRHYKMCTKTEYTCRECSYKTRSKNCFITHIKSVHNAIDVLPIFCDICLKNFTRQPHLKRHKESVHVDNTQSFKCDCILKNKRTLQMHLRIHTKANTLMKCSACRRNFKNKVLFEKHISLNNCLQCQICDQKFDVLEKFIRHSKMCTKTEYTCRECSYKTDTKNCLIKHMKSVHNAIDVLPIFCDICIMSFERQKSLKRHQETVHAENIQSLKCDKCGLTLKNKYTLQNHLKKHTSEVDTLMKCPTCGKIFKYKVSYVKHISLNNCLQCKICDQ
ncbi:PR domain zinc finger protein 5-like [Odontomachus brunneus]|uniref:PR domain zinc finger protein 5-like n=1 Tax=Odontomachus brunneus TaxID=486640 RepID=UPI0013F2547E|nr:PR domain zinc finger protein 5-like [Odontomachus brunneus]